ncbi:phage protein NinX family protein [Providencia rettgeri]
MSKYTELSDFEINKKVAEKLGLHIDDFYKQVSPDDYNNSEIYVSVNKNDYHKDSFDPCNNLVDAMPIIIENGISMVRVNNTWSARQFNNHCIEINGDNYYRIAMEVYLLMNEK